MSNLQANNTGPKPQQNNVLNTQNCQLFMLDNLDSFTYNLVDEFECLGFNPVVYRNTLSAEFIFNQMQQVKAQGQQVILVLSPGPGTPTSAGCLMALINLCIGYFPIIGICLGHQALILHYGGTIERADDIVHGKASAINHCQTGAFTNISNPLPVARYHSLVGSNIPKKLTVTASFTNQQQKTIVMAIEQQNDAVIGMQFHPESILTTHGSNLLAQTIDHILSLAAQNFGVQHD
jgi:anthranilate synthase component 2